MSESSGVPGKIGFLFHMGHGHYTQFLNFQECFPPEHAGRAEWIPLWGDHSDNPRCRSRWVRKSRHYSLHQQWHAQEGVGRHQEWDALFFAAVQRAFLPHIRRHRSYFYIDLSPSCIRQLAYPPPSEGRLLRAVKDAVQGGVIRSARGVFTMSEWAKAGIVKDYRVPAERVHVVLPGANLRKWEFVDRTCRPASAPVRILMVGGWFQQKGGPELLEWAERTALKGWEMDIVTWLPCLPDWIRELAGAIPEDEPHATALGPRLPAVRVHTGLKANSAALMELFRQADVFCLPTIADASSIASLEAMASGLPVAVNAVGGIPELIRDGETGLLMRAGDHDEMAERLETLIRDRGLRLRLGAAARLACETFYNADRQTRQIVETIDADRP